MALARRPEIHYTPQHGSWLNIAEIELSVLKRQCLSERIPEIDKMREKIKVWNTERNTNTIKGDAVILHSFGKNRKDDNGKNDDIVYFIKFKFKHFKTT